MCGIAGFNWNDRKLIKKMTDTIAHRGPDGEGHFTDNNISLGHRRLAIIDLTDKGEQPMKYKDYTIVFNGEIYNFKEIRETLENENHNFVSDSDTEVVLHAYEKWGKDCVKHFNGMWAFCIYDRLNNILFLSRDRFGIKPLYYYNNDDKFIFASELKAIKECDINLTINKTALNFYFYQKYVGGRYSIFDNINKLLPGENIVYDLLKSKISLNRYYSLIEEINKAKKISIKERVGKIKPLLEDAINKRLIADVPVGSFLSGGLDSSYISAIIAKNQNDFSTFSIGFTEKSYNELPFSQKVAAHIKTKHHYKTLSLDEILFEKVLKNLDEPFGDASILPTYLLSKITREHVTVALSGDAGDEVFAGYDTHLAYKIAKYIPSPIKYFIKAFVKLIPPSEKKVSLEFKIKRFVNTNNHNAEKRHLDWMATFPEKTRTQLLKDHFQTNNTFINTNDKNSLAAIQLSDLNYYLPEDIMKKADTASMLNSLEVRIPFLDYRVVPLVLSLPETYKIKWLKTKYLLKRFAKGLLPLPIVNRKKRGFTVPISRWIKESETINGYLGSEKYYAHNLLNKEYINTLLKNHNKGIEDNSRQLWLVFVFNYWYDKAC